MPVARSTPSPIALIVAGAAIATAVPAYADSDGQAWAATTASGAVRGDLFLWLEAQARGTDGVTGGSQTIARPAIGLRIAPDAHAIAGYAWVRTDPESGRTTNEHRLWQQVQFAAVRGRDGAPRVLSRTRLEQRMVAGRADTGWRLRQFVRVQAPVAAAGKVLAVAYTEGFVNLNTTDWGARGGVDQWRNFVGIGVPVGKGLRLEPGYLNQRVFRRGADRTNHVLSATLFAGL